METHAPLRMLLRPLAAALLLACGTPQAALLGEAAPCRVELEFAEGGAIDAPAGATISFGTGGLLDLGSGGSIDYGSGGSAEPATTGSAVPDLAAGGSIRLGPGGSIHFGNGGRLLGGDAAQVETPDDGTMEFRTPSHVGINSETAVHAGVVSDFGSVRVQARRIDIAPAPFRFSGSPEGDFVLLTTDVAWIDSFENIGGGTISADESINLSGPPSTDGGSSGVGSGGSGSGAVFTSGAGTISVGDFSGGGTLESPGTVTVVSPGSIEVVDTSQGGGAFPGLLLALFATLGFARRSRR